jgi:tetratricopeptide (TPR) repeat protein
LKPLVRRNALLITETSLDVDCQRLAAAIKLVLERAAAEQRKREEKERLEAEQREKARLEAQQREKERLAAELREKKRLATEVRQREIASKSNRLPQSTAPSQAHGTAQTGATRTLESKDPIKQGPLKQLAPLVVLGLILIGGWFVVSELKHGGREASPSSTDPAFYYGRGLDFYRTGDYDKAISDFNEAIRLNPKDGRDYYMRGWAYKLQGKILRRRPISKKRNSLVMIAH